MSDAVAEITDEAQLMEIAKATADHCWSLTVQTTEEHAEACAYIQRIAFEIKRIEEWFRPLKDAANKAHKALTTRENETLAPLRKAKQILGGQIAAFQTKQEEERLAEQRRIQAKLDEEARQRALEANAKAMELADAGETQAAVEVLEKAKGAATPPTIRLPEPPKPRGITPTKTWKFRVNDAALVPREYLMVDETKIGKVVRALKGNVQIPGVVVYSEDSVAVRS